MKDEVERAVMSFAKKWYSFNYELIFYDVTTLYFVITTKIKSKAMLFFFYNCLDINSSFDNKVMIIVPLFCL